MTKLAALIAQMEGFGKPGVVPTLRHNPGDLRHSPHSQHPDLRKPEDIGTIDTDAHGWQDLERQLQLYAARGMTLRQAVWQFAPPNENNTAHYLDFVCKGLGMGPDSPMREVLKVIAS